VQTVTFHAGFASTAGHLLIWLAANLVRLGVWGSLATLARPLHAVAHRIEPWLSDKGAMFVALQGVDHHGCALQLEWQLLAAQNHGPHIPCGAAIALATRLARGEIPPPGALPCMGVLTVSDYLAALHGFDVREVAP
jgi:hypothetical protein